VPFPLVEPAEPLPDSYPPEDLAIRLSGLVKEYYLGQDRDRTLKSFILRKVRREEPDILRVLTGLDLEVPKGQVLGICGANGAGKSTLLKIIAGIIPPTAGEVEVKGRVASLLELGAGFHPEMTGMENVLLNGAILGIREQDLRQRISSIFQMAGLERFTDTPIKHYSSGMVQRLGFAIASFLDPDVMILDEIFAVGDAIFQQTALDMFSRFKSRKKTILLVSHDLRILENFCDRVILLAGGGILMDGPPKVVTHQYATLCWQHVYQIGTDQVPFSVTNRMGDQRMRLKKVMLLNENDEEQRAFRQFGCLKFRFCLVCEDQDLSEPYLSVKVIDNWGRGVCQDFGIPEEGHNSAPAEFQMDLILNEILLSPGSYSLEVIVATGFGLILDSWSFAETFSIIPPLDSGLEMPDPGVFFYHPSRWETLTEEARGTTTS